MATGVIAAAAGAVGIAPGGWYPDTLVTGVGVEYGLGDGRETRALLSSNFFASAFASSYSFNFFRLLTINRSDKNIQIIIIAIIAIIMKLSVSLEALPLVC